MLPILFRIGPVEIPSYGLCLATGILLGWFYFFRQFPKSQNKDVLGNLLLYSIFAGLFFSRINYIVEHTNEIKSLRDFFGMLFSRSGLTVYGGILGGIITACLYCRKHHLPVLQILDAGSLAICIGYFFGRLGCQMAGDGDYGTPSNLPWAMAYPHGTVPTFQRVHPTPLYEMLAYAVIFVILLQLKKRELPSGRLFFVFLVLAGIERFAVEFIRLNPVFAIGLTEAQIVSLVLILVGMLGSFRSVPQPA